MDPNVNNPGSVEALYPQVAFDEDAARNAAADADVLHGLRIESAPDAEGRFGLARARRQAGEATGEALFLFPDGSHLLAAAEGGLREDGVAAAGPDARRKAYDGFMARVLDVARTAAIQDPIGRGEDRLEGFRGG